MWNTRYIEKLKLKREEAKNTGGLNTKPQKPGGSLTARERMEILFDEGTFCEVNDFMRSRTTNFEMQQKAVPGDGVITGYGKINGRTAFASSEDYAVKGGSLGEYHAKRICHIQDMAVNMGAPFIMINESGGARIEEGIDALCGYGDIFYRCTQASGIIPQIAVVMGPCAGGICYASALCDFVFMAENTGYMFITGPKVVKEATHEQVDADSLGGARVHMEQSGVAHFSYADERSCLLAVRELLGYLPGNNDEKAPCVPGRARDLCSGLAEVVSDNRKKCYDVHAVIGAVADRGSFMEVHKSFAKNAVVGFGRIDGSTVGFIANQPNFMGGSLDINASDKIARFIRFCDCFHIPLISFVDVPAFLPGVQQESNGIIRHGAKMLYAYSEATVPKITVILRKAYGGAYIAMCSKGLCADLVYAWPIAEIAVMGAEAAANIIFKREIDAATNPQSKRAEVVQTYEEAFMNPYMAAERGYVDEVILPEETRMRICSALDLLRTKKVQTRRKKHGNIPL